jgi:hypothetical protein
VQQAAEPVSPDDLDIGIDGVGKGSQRAGVVQGPVRTVPVEIGLVLNEHLAQVVLVDDEGPVEEFAASAAHPSFHDRVGPRRRLHLMTMIGIVVCG